MKATYKSSGVDVAQANRFVKSISSSVKSTLTPAVLNRSGSFGSLVELKKKGYKRPVLVSSTDGVGTKLLVANSLGKHDTVGIDLVAMNVNDILCTGAKPLFFLDYIACGKLNPKVLRDVVKGIAKGCKDAQCSLVGGETAEMPGMYQRGEYDLAGFALGVVDKANIIDGSSIKAGDCLIGLPSSGIHSNGYSLVRKVLSRKEIKAKASELLQPTKIYTKEITEILKKFKLKGMAHITGGAYYDKLTKILPKGKCFRIFKRSWPVPFIFQIIQKRGKIKDREMYSTFNMGIGMAFVIDRKQLAAVQSFLKSKKIKFYNIGEVINDKSKKVII